MANQYQNPFWTRKLPTLHTMWKLRDHPPTRTFCFVKTIGHLSLVSLYDTSRKDILIFISCLACMLQAAQQFSGFNTAMYYAATILRMAGFRSHQDSTTVAIIVSATNMVFTIVAVIVIDRAGRRRMLIITMLIMAAGLIALGATFAAQQGFITAQSDCSAYTTHCARCVMDDNCGWSISQDKCMPLDVLGSDLFNSKTGCPARGNDTAITAMLILFLIIYVAGYALGLGYAP